MPRVFSIAVTIAACLILIPMLGRAQQAHFYPYTGPNVYQRHHPAPKPAARRQVPAKPYYYYLRPPADVVRQWKKYQKWLDAQHLRRSPLNPESSVEYMLRTFF